MDEILKMGLWQDKKFKKRDLERTKLVKKMEPKNVAAPVNLSKRWPPGILF